MCATGPVDRQREMSTRCQRGIVVDAGSRRQADDEGGGTGARKE